MEEIIPIMAPQSTISRTQFSVAEPVLWLSFLSVLTTGAASSTSVCQGIRPVSTTATPM